MTQYLQEELDGDLRLAVEELVATTKPEQPLVELNQQVLLRLKASMKPVPRRNKRVKTIMKYALAASILAVVMSIVGFSQNSSKKLYAQVAEQIEKIQSLVFRVQFVQDNDLDNFFGEDGNKVTFVAPSKYRVEEQVGTIQIVDTEIKKMIHLMPKTKEALVFEGEIVNLMNPQSPMPFVTMMRNHFRTDRNLDDSIRKLGEREINGAWAIGLQSTAHGETIDIWVDASSHLPVEVRIRFTAPGIAEEARPNLWYVMSNIEYNPSIDPALMSVNVPEGYTKIRVPTVSLEHSLIKPSPAKLDDLIALLKMCAAYENGNFPSSLAINDNERTPMAIMKRHSNKVQKTFDAATKDEQKLIMQEMVELGTVMGRASVFLMSLKKENDFHYFNNAKQNQKDRPLLWYSPEGDGNYRVVFADLSVVNMSVNSLPPQPADATIKKQASAKTHTPWSTPMLRLPRSAVRKYSELQAIRKQGKQADVRFLDLMIMHEFVESEAMESGAMKRLVPGQLPVMQVVTEGWRPKRSLESNRLEFLSEFPNLRGLKVGGFYLTHQELNAISKCKNLERLSLYGVQVLEKTPRILQARDLKKLQGLTKLQSLDLSQSNFAGGLHHLSKLPQLRTLYLGSFENLNDKTIAELALLPHLETLTLAPVYGTNPKTMVTNTGLESLTKIKNLKTLNVGWHGKWTMPVEQLRKLLPNVEIKAGGAVSVPRQ